MNQTPHITQSAGNLLKLNPVQTEMSMSFTPSSGQESIALRKNEPFDTGSKIDHSGQKQQHHMTENNLKAFPTLGSGSEEDKSQDSSSDFKLQRNMSIKECASELEEDPKGAFSLKNSAFNVPINHL